MLPPQIYIEGIYKQWRHTIPGVILPTGVTLRHTGYIEYIISIDSKTRTAEQRTKLFYDS